MSDPGNDKGTLGVASTVVALGFDAGEAPTEVAPAVDNGDESAPTPAKERYLHKGVLGEGGMGRVDHMWDVDLMRDLAVKRIRPELASDVRLMQQFLWEARVSAHLEHPNIVPVHELGRGPDLYFTMKHVRGISLEHALERLQQGEPSFCERFPLPRRLRLFLQLGNAISFAHSHGVAHRDLKPANVMLGEHGEVLVMDWGLAMPLPGPAGDDVRPALPQGVAEGHSGTPQYMSPEQARGETVDERSDVYTLGVMLYELASLQRPYDGPTVPAILVKLATGEHAPLAEVMPDASPSLIAVVERAMALEPADRYPDVRELLDDVECVLDGRIPEAEDASIARRAAHFYLARDPAMGRLRVMDVDMWTGAGFLFGMGVGVLVAETIGSYWWLFIVASLAVATPTTIRWLRYRREARHPHRTDTPHPEQE